MGFVAAGNKTAYTARYRTTGHTSAVRSTDVRRTTGHTSAVRSTDVRRTTGHTSAVRSTDVRRTNKPKKTSPRAGNMVIWSRVLFIATVAILLLFGLMMVYSASSIFAINEIGDAAYYFKKQLQFIVIGVFIAVALAFVNYRVMSGKLAWAFWGIVVALLIVTLVNGYLINGATRWLEIGGFNFQPGELAKIALLLVCTHLIVRLHESGTSMILLALAACGVFVPALLILAQPDLGTMLIALSGVVIIMWLGAVPKRIILIFVGILAVLGAFAIFIADFRQDRIMSFIDPWAAPLSDGYQVINAFYAFAEGGLFGVGIGQSHQKFAFLPEAQNDFIFAIIGEELGIVGAFAVVLLFLLLIFSALMIARSSSDLRARMIAGTAAVLIGFQAFLNIFCVMGWAPVTGKPLPFISSGGTSMLSSMILVGLILSVSFHSDARDASLRRRDNLVLLDGGMQMNRMRTKGSLTGTPIKAPAKAPIKAPAKAPAAIGARAPALKPTNTLEKTRKRTTLEPFPVRPNTYRQGTASGGSPALPNKTRQRTVSEGFPALPNKTKQRGGFRISQTLQPSLRRTFSAPPMSLSSLTRDRTGFVSQMRKELDQEKRKQA